MSFDQLLDDLTWLARTNLQDEIEAGYAEAKRAVRKGCVAANWRLNELEAEINAHALGYYPQTLYRYGTRRNAARPFDSSKYADTLSLEHQGDPKDKSWSGYSQWGGLDYPVSDYLRQQERQAERLKYLFDNYRVNWLGYWVKK